MKWALAQLYKYNDKPFKFSAEYDFKDNIANIDDILDISIVTVEGVGQHVYEDRYKFDMHIKTKMVLEDAVTLDPIDFPIDIHVTEIFDVVDDGEVNVIQGTTIDLEPVIWEIVYLEKPMRITKHVD
ncbi:MAG TPA: hypothetical protein GXZ48_01925 [Acholeplasmataceae bacterium]|nr:hypothetical protein [Acholeplasmataceae bacterium]